MQPESRAALRRLLEQGWVDAVRTMHPEAPMYTFWDYMRNRWQRDAGLRIDLLLLSADVAPRLVDAGVDRDMRGEQNASDHAAAWVALRDDSRARRRGRSVGSGSEGSAINATRRRLRGGRAHALLFSSLPPPVASPPPVRRVEN